MLIKELHRKLSGKNPDLEVEFIIFDKTGSVVSMELTNLDADDMAIILKILAKNSGE